MNKSFCVWSATFGLVVLASWGWQRGNQRSTQTEITAAREQIHGLVELRRENQRLVAAQVTDAELARLRADHEAVGRLREEIDGMKKRNEAMERVQVARPDPSFPHPLSAIVVPERNWKNVGRATPGAAIETALWAGTAGDFDAMAATLVLEETARPRAAVLFASLPEVERVRFGSAEKLIAALAIKEIPGSVSVSSAAGDAEQVKILFQTQRTTGSAMIVKEVELALRRFSDGWRLVVPETAVNNYAAALAVGEKKSP